MPYQLDSYNVLFLPSEIVLDKTDLQIKTLRDEGFIANIHHCSDCCTLI